MIIMMDVEKQFDKIQHPFMMKMLKKVDSKGTLNHYAEAVFEKLTANIILNVKTFKIKNKTRMSIPFTFIRHSTGGPNHSN